MIKNIIKDMIGTVFLGTFIISSFIFMVGFDIKYLLLGSISLYLLIKFMKGETE